MSFCLYPGSFDPPTLGHEDIARRAAKIFGRVVVCIMQNDAKKGGLFPAEERAEMLRAVFADCDDIEVMVGSGLTAELAREMGAVCIVKGMRDASDFCPEASQAAANLRYAGIETAFLYGAPEHSFISSSMVREIMRRGGRLTGFVPDAIVERLQAYRFK